MHKLLFCLACLCLLTINTAHSADERFTVEIKVDVTDESASVAREKAMNSASVAAVNAVARKISTSAGSEKIAKLNEAQILNFIKETSVLNEKTSDVRYMADLRFVINEELLKQYMEEREIPLLAQKDTSILIVPIFREFSDDTPMLWENDNPWKQAWERAKPSSAVKFLSLAGTASNMEAIDAQKASVSDSFAMERLQSISGANDVYILDASYKGVEGIIIVATSLSGERFEIEVPGAKSSGDELFDNAVTESKIQIEERILKANMAEASQESELTILYPFKSLGDWISAEQKIKGISEITNMQVQAMAPQKAQFKIWHIGDLNTLQNLLKRQGYRLIQNDTYMTLEKFGE